MMEVSQLAIEKLKEAMAESGDGAGSLRVVAMPAETGGLQYMLTVEKESQPDDTVLRLDGLSFLMDSDSAPFLDDATIDYVEQFGGRVGFVINNPAFASGCGCGNGGGCGCGASHGGGGGGQEESHGSGGCGCGASHGGGGGGQGESHGGSGGGCGCGHGH